MIIGVFLFSFALTALTNFIKINDEKFKYYRDNMDYLNDLQKSYEINKTLYQKISRHLFFINNSNENNKNILINDLPITLKREIILNMNKTLISKCKFFKNLFDKQFLVEILKCLKSTTSNKNESLIKQGDFVEEVIFISKGILQLETVISIDIDKKNFKIIQKKKSFKNKKICYKCNISNKKQLLCSKDCEKKIKSIFNDVPKDFKNELNFKDDNNEILNIIFLLKFAILRKNEYFGDSLIIDNVRSEFTLKTKSSTSVQFLMNKFDLLQLLKDNPINFDNIHKH